jgi:hypothetical protein
MRGVFHLPLDGQLSGSKGELNRVHPNLRAKEAAMPRRKFVPQRLTSVPLAPPPSVRLGPLTQRLLSGAHWRGLDEFPFCQVWADDVEHVLRFLESEGRLATFLDVVQGVRTPQHRNACLAEARAACHLSRNGFRIVQWEPPGQGRTKGEIMVSLPGSPDIFVEVKHPGWQGEYRHRRIAEMGKLTPQQEEQCVARMKQGKYLPADGGRVAPHVAAMDVVRRNALPKLTDQCPNLVIVVDDLQVSPVGLPSLADLVEREFFDPDHDPGDPDDDLAYERLGGVLFLGNPEYENNYKTIHYGTDFVQNKGALPRCALPPPVSDLFSRMREESRLRVEEQYTGPSLFDILRRKQLTRPHLAFEALGESLLPSKVVIPQPNRLGGFPMVSFADQHGLVTGREFQSRTGIWICDLTGPVDVSDVDRRIFYLRFEQIEPDQRWAGPTVRTLELRTSLISFTHDPDYDPWLLHVVDGFLDSEEVSGLREAYAVERAPRTRA